MWFETVFATTLVLKGPTKPEAVVRPQFQRMSRNKGGPLAMSSAGSPFPFRGNQIIIQRLFIDPADCDFDA
jgi:hypothetical protein